MVLIRADKIISNTLFQEKVWRNACITKEFPNKEWTKPSINRLIKKIETTGSAAHMAGSGYPLCTRTTHKFELVEELGLS